jgi:hypothetical protein
VIKDWALPVFGCRALRGAHQEADDFR